MGVVDVEVEAAEAAAVARRRLETDAATRAVVERADEDARDARRVVDAREDGDATRARATRCMTRVDVWGVTSRQKSTTTMSAFARTSRVDVSTVASARRWSRSSSTSRRVAGPRATSDDDDAVKTAFAKVYAPDSNKSIHFGVFTRDVDASAVPDDDERASRRARAARELAVIDDEERARRLVVGKVASAATAATAAAQLAFGASRPERAFIAIPLFFALGFVGSAKTGA